MITRPRRDRFGQLPVWWGPVIRKLDSFRVALALAGCADANGTAKASNLYLAGSARIDRRNVRDALLDLQRLGLVILQAPTNGKRATTYVLVWNEAAWQSSGGSRTPCKDTKEQASITPSLGVPEPPQTVVPEPPNHTRVSIIDEFPKNEGFERLRQRFGAKRTATG